MTIKLGRDPFARETTIKKMYYCSELTTCSWCGNNNTTPRGYFFLYQYIVEKDSIGPNFNAIPGLFCCIACCRNYNGE